MKKYEELAKSVIYKKKGNNFILDRMDPCLELVGEGRSAFAFRIKGTDKVLKVFYPPFERIAKEEAEVYARLMRNPFYPKLYGSGKNFLVIDYVSGRTLFDCLTEGIPISSRQIREVDLALRLARDRGLNPSDIHLRNIIVTPGGKVRLIDVARFRQEKKCSQWDDLKAAFYKLYNRKLFPKKIPERLINLIAYFYKKGMLPSISLH